MIFDDYNWVFKTPVGWFWWLVWGLYWYIGDCHNLVAQKVGGTPKSTTLYNHTCLIGGKKTDSIYCLKRIFGSGIVVLRGSLTVFKRIEAHMVVSRDLKQWQHGKFHLDVSERWVYFGKWWWVPTQTNQVQRYSNPTCFLNACGLQTKSHLFNDIW